MRRRSFLGGLVAALTLGRLPRDKPNPASRFRPPPAGDKVDWSRLPEPWLEENLCGKGWSDGDRYWSIWGTPYGLTMTEDLGSGTEDSPTVRRVYRSRGVGSGWELIQEATFTGPESEEDKRRYIEACWRASGLV
jgi:hypothetical protein